MHILTLNKINIKIRQLHKNAAVLKNICFSLEKGEILAIVGESGSGKSTLCKSILGLLPENFQTDGEMSFSTKAGASIRITEFDQRSLINLRGNEIGFVFQDTISSLNPVLRCGNQLVDLIGANSAIEKNNEKDRVYELLHQVGLNDTNRILSSYPHQLSGGMVQRFALALALAKEPGILIADEPAASLDPISKNQYLKLLKQIKGDRGLSIILITHNVNDALSFAESIIVVYGGRIVEQGKTEALKTAPAHPYTKGLQDIASSMNNNTMPHPIPGDSPSLNRPVSGCPFHPRCFNAQEICKADFPRLTKLSANHSIFCNFPVRKT